MTFPNDTDYTYAERFGDFDAESELGGQGSKHNKYATPIDDSVTAGVVAALGDSLEADLGLTGAIADAVSTKLGETLELDAELAGAIADATVLAFVADATYPVALADAFEQDSDFLGAIAEAVSGELVSTFETAITGEIAHTGPADAVTLTVSDTGLDNVGDNGIVPGSVTFTITANDDSETLAVTDSDNGDGTGNLSGTGAGISVADDGVSTITYATGAWTITASEALKENEDILVDYSYSRDALVGDVGLTDGALAAISAELAGDATFKDALVDWFEADSDFLTAIKAQAFPIWWVDTDVSAEGTGGAIEDEHVIVTFTQFNVGGTVETGRSQIFRLFLYQDQAGTPELPATVTMTATTGMILGPIVAAKEIQVMTDSVTGTLVLDFVDSGDVNVTFDVVLVNDVTGECHTATVVFATD